MAERLVPIQVQVEPEPEPKLKSFALDPQDLYHPLAWRSLFWDRMKLSPLQPQMEQLYVLQAKALQMQRGLPLALQMEGSGHVLHLLLLQEGCFRPSLWPKRCS